jgi:mannose-6-phosphate isomerase class I
MKKLTTLAALVLGLSALAMAAEFKGFVEDTACSTKPAMKADADCAKKCIKGGSPAVLVTADGKIYKISNQDKITAHAGESVTVTGSVKDDVITVDSVK